MKAIDQADGKLDGKWRDNDIDEFLQGFDTPARTPYQQRVVEAVVKREDFGRPTTSPTCCTSTSRRSTSSATSGP